MKRALLTSLAILGWPALAQAEPGSSSTSTGAPPAVHVIDDTPPPAPIAPRARDLLGSHVLLGAAVGPTWSVGYFGSRLAASDGLGTGLSLRADIGFGVSRYVAVGLWGGYAPYTHGNHCDPCSGRAVAIGPFVRYQLSQGLRLDPWFSLGGAYRQVSFAGASGPRDRLNGLEWLRVELGADYYVLSGFGVGPYGAVGLSSYFKRPSDAGDSAVSTELTFGLRFLIDVPGR